MLRNKARKKLSIAKISGTVEQHQTVEQAIRWDMAVTIVQIEPTAQPPKTTHAIGRSGYHRSLGKARLQGNGLRLLCFG